MCMNLIVDTWKNVAFQFYSKIPFVLFIIIIIINTSSSGLLDLVRYSASLFPVFQKFVIVRWNPILESFVIKLHNNVKMHDLVGSTVTQHTHASLHS